MAVGEKRQTHFSDRPTSRRLCRAIRAVADRPDDTCAVRCPRGVTIGAGIKREPRRDAALRRWFSIFRLGHGR